MNQLEGRKLVRSLLPTLTGQLSQFWLQDLTVPLSGQTGPNLHKNRLGEAADPPTALCRRRKPTANILPQTGVYCTLGWDLGMCWGKTCFLLVLSRATIPIHRCHMWHISHSHISMWTIQIPRATQEQTHKLTLLLYQHLSTLIKPSLEWSSKNTA